MSFFNEYIEKFNNNVTEASDENQMMNDVKTTNKQNEEESPEIQEIQDTAPPEDSGTDMADDEEDMGDADMGDDSFDGGGDDASEFGDSGMGDETEEEDLDMPEDELLQRSRLTELFYALYVVYENSITALEKTDPPINDTSRKYFFRMQEYLILARDLIYGIITTDMLTAPYADLIMKYSAYDRLFGMLTVQLKTILSTDE